MCPFPAVLSDGRASCRSLPAGRMLVVSLCPGQIWKREGREKGWAEIGPHVTVACHRGTFFQFVTILGTVAKMSKAEKREYKHRRQQNQIKLHPPFTVKLRFVFLVLFSSHSHQSVSFSWFSRGFVPRSFLRGLLDDSPGRCVCRQYFSFSPRLPKR